MREKIIGMYAWVDEKPAIEYHAGLKVRKVSPSSMHAIVAGAAYRVVYRLSDRRGQVGVEWHFDTSVQLGEKTILVPDVAFVKKERLYGMSPGFLQVPSFAPDVAVDVRSPTDRPGEREWKIERYLRAGASLVLDVDPVARSVRALATGDERRFVSGQTVEHPAVPWLAFPVDEAFQDLDAP